MAQDRYIPVTAEEAEKDKESHGNTRLPFGLCERYGIQLPNGATPRDAWDALKGKTGLTPDDFYRDLRQKEKNDANVHVVDTAISKKFIAAKTVQEAETFARDTLGIENTDYKGIDLEVANEMNAAFQRGIDLCPQIKDRMKCVGNAQRVNKAFREEYAVATEKYARNAYPGLPNEYYKQFGKRQANKAVGKIEANIVAFARRGASSIPELNAVIKKYDGIVGNDKLCKNGQHLKEMLEFNKQSGFLSVGTIAGTFDHEVAHQIDFALGLSKNAELVELFNSMSKQEISSGLSRYGASMVAEFIAEGWAEYCNSDNPRTIAKRIGEIIEREAKGEKGRTY